MTMPDWYDPKNVNPHLEEVSTRRNKHEVTMPFESDPNGIDQHSPGAKLDQGKNRLGLVIAGFDKALWEVGKVGTYGANKYTDNGWREVENGMSRYTDAMLRHQLKMAREDIDPESGLLHAAHAAWNALAVLQLIIEGKYGTDSGRI